MPLAARNDDFAIVHDGITLHLRPSLRAATRLQRPHDGFPALFRKVIEFDTVTIRAVILQAATDRSAEKALLAHLALQPVLTFSNTATGPEARLCAALMPADSDDAAPAKTRTKNP